MPSASFRYSAPITIPAASTAKDKTVNEEINYLLDAFRTLAAHVDTLTGGLSPLKVDWAQYTPDGVYSITSNSKIYAVCNVNISYGAMVNLYLNAGDLTARYAQASAVGLVASGFCNEPGGFLAGELGEFICGPGINTGIGGLTIGNWYFLDPASLSGQVTAAAPAVPGQIYQICGQAIAANKLLCGSFNNWIKL